jgi:hypothetical protein
MKFLLAYLSLMLMLVVILLMAIDALEYEVTGRCIDCLVLQHVSPAVD